ncbi:Leucine-rich repeat protein 2-like protein [Drosera capensis]
MNSLEGHIPEELGGLNSLVSLDLFHNNLTGQIPPSLSKLSNLKFLRPNNNRLTGRIPKALTKLESLKILYIRISLSLFNVSLPQVYMLHLNFCAGMYQTTSVALSQYPVPSPSSLKKGDTFCEQPSPGRTRADRICSLRQQILQLKIQEVDDIVIESLNLYFRGI